MAKVLRIHNVASAGLVEKVQEEILLLTRGVACPECVEIIFESVLHQRLMAEISEADHDILDHRSATPCRPATVLGFKYRVAYGPGVRFGSLTVITRAEVVFK